MLPLTPSLRLDEIVAKIRSHYSIAQTEGGFVLTDESAAHLIQTHVAEQNAVACGERDDLLCQIGQLETTSLEHAAGCRVKIEKLKTGIEAHRGCPRFGSADELLLKL